MDLLANDSVSEVNVHHVIVSYNSISSLLSVKSLLMH